MRYALAIFDLDGTILDTLKDLAVTINYALRLHGYPERTMQEVRHFVGNGIRKLVERAVPENATEADIDQVFQSFTTYYKEHCMDYTKPYEGIMEMLEKLRQAGYKTAVVSNKADYAVKILCEQYFPGAFDAYVGERENVRKKPYPDSVNEVLNNLHVKREDAVYIGDSDVDIETARNASMDHIIVDWGFREHEFLVEHGAKVICSKPEEILECM
ncbi:HAD family hydrolase [Anaerosporobacter faecicola]|uniref:HAD family hydrolase n=1 Tax=Anaerosporobacter faecicola TaxID=2718714 RepID=UPI00143BFA6E|nr:HAD family hydrolase [Anaerosporobacter faecicola]